MNAIIKFNFPCQAAITIWSLAKHLKSIDNKLSTEQLGSKNSKQSIQKANFCVCYHMQITHADSNKAKKKFKKDDDHRHYVYF